MSDSPPRRVLIVSGAGASTSLGRSGVPVPLMPEWATRLVDALGHRARQIGLEPDMAGDKFETALGRFLAFEAALPTVAPFAHLGQPAAQPLGVNVAVANWFQQAANESAHIRRAIWANLFDNFGLGRIDASVATRSYNKLHELIRASDDDGPEAYLAHATTNYDPAIEIAIGNSANLTLVDGFVPQPGNGRDVYAPNLLIDQWQTTNQVPVLHIHGAVGWYFQADGSITRLPTDDPFDERRTPALLLPNDRKNPDLFDTPIRESWNVFRRQLRQASHVLFLGHSLHDPHIVDEVRAADTPVAVVTYARPNQQGHYPEPLTTEAGRIRELLPRAAVFSGAFGQSADWPDVDSRALERWLLKTSPGHR